MLFVNVESSVLPPTTDRDTGTLCASSSRSRAVTSTVSTPFADCAPAVAGNAPARPPAAADNQAASVARIVSLCTGAALSLAGAATQLVARDVAAFHDEPHPLHLGDVA